jgi:ketosteroid isomerase-like protein
MRTISRAWVLIVSIGVAGACGGPSTPAQDSTARADSARVGAPQSSAAPSAVASVSASASASASPSAVASAAPSSSAATSARTPRRPLGKDEKQAIVQKFVDAFNAHDTVKLDAVYAHASSGPPRPQVEMSTPTGFRDAPLPDALAERKKLFDMLPDARMNVGRIYISPGSVLTFEWVLTATDTKGVNGQRPTGAKIGVPAVTTMWLDPLNAPVIGIERTYLDWGTVFGQARGARDVRAPVAPPAAMSEWPSPSDADLPQQPEGQDAGGDPFWDPLTDKKLDAFAAVLADDVVWRDLSRRDDFVGKKAVLAELTKRKQNGPWPTSSSGGGNAPDTRWDVTRAGKKSELHTADVIEWRQGKVASWTTYANALER